MRRVRSLAAVAPLLLACCSLPPRVDDRSTPTAGYETFRGAIARGEHGREWASLSDGLRAKLGLEHRGDWIDLRTVVLDQKHLLVRGICRSEVASDPEALPDGRVRLVLDFPFGYEGRVTLRRVVVMRAYVPEEPDPVVYQQLSALRLEPDEKGRRIIIPLRDIDAEDLKYVFEELERGVARFEIAEEWLLDDFAAGGETPSRLREEHDARKTRE